MSKIHPKVEEVLDTIPLSQTSRRTLLRGAGLVSAAAAASALLAACTDENVPVGAVGNFPSTPRWRFVLVCHVTTNPFFTPTQYGAEDACRLLGIEYQWTGSVNSVVAEMVDATNTAITSRADGIALCVVDQEAFRAPVSQALDAGIPVVSFNADGARDNRGTDRLAYIGQGLYESGYALGQRALQQIDEGEVAGFIATPGQLNIQPRIDGCEQAFRDSGKPVTFTPVATNADITQGLSIIDAYVQGHQDVAGLLAVDAGSTQSVGQMVDKYGLRDRGLQVAGGFDLIPETLNAIRDGHLDYTIDQQPYLQGFLPVIALYLYQLSGGLISPTETNTGLLFVTADNVGPYQSTTSRYEGSDSAPKLIERSGAIAH
jgi:simple sugar transport system substrate-binding protein